MSPMRVAVAMGGRSAEREVSLRSGAAVLEALDRERFEPVSLVIESDGRWRVGDAAPASSVEAVAALRSAGVEVVFLALHGPGGEDGAIQGFFEWAGLRYTGSGVAASAIAMDKVAARAVLAMAGLDVAPAVVVERGSWPEQRARVLASIAALGRPVFVKAPNQGSSFGVTRVAEAGDAAVERALEATFEFGPKVLVERAIVGVEVTAPVLGNARDAALLALPLVEIRPRRKDYFDYHEKYSADGAEELCPAVSLTEEQAARARAAGERAHRALGCDGMSRTDLIVSGDRVVVLEVNTIPGLTTRSLLPKAASAAGLPFGALVTRVLDLALETGGGR